MRRFTRKLVPVVKPRRRERNPGPARTSSDVPNCRKLVGRIPRTSYGCCGPAGVPIILLISEPRHLRKDRVV